MSGRKIDQRARAFQALDVCLGNLDAAGKALRSIGANALAVMVLWRGHEIATLRDIVAEAYPSEESTRTLATRRNEEAAR